MIEGILRKNKETEDFLQKYELIREGFQRILAGVSEDKRTTLGAKFVSNVPDVGSFSGIVLQIESDIGADKAIENADFGLYLWQTGYEQPKGRAHTFLPSFKHVRDGSIKKRERTAIEKKLADLTIILDNVEDHR